MQRDIRKIVLTGPESSGKTTLAVALAAHYAAPLAPEYARLYLEKLARPYKEADLLHIARGHLTAEEMHSRQSTGLLFCDTALVVLKIWSEYKYGRCHPFILEALQKRTYDLYLLCRPDLPWTFDPLRENPHDREELFERYRQELQGLKANYVEIGGQGEERLKKAIQAINHHITIWQSGI